MLYCVFICLFTNIFGTLMSVQLATHTTFGCLFKQSARRFHTSCHTCNLLGDCLFKPSDLLYPLCSQPHKFPYTKVPSNLTYGFPFCAMYPGRHLIKDCVTQQQGSGCPPVNNLPTLRSYQQGYALAKFTQTPVPTSQHISGTSVPLRFGSRLPIQMARKDCDLSLVHRLCHDLFLRLTRRPGWWIGFTTNRSCPVRFFHFGFHFPGLAFTVVPSKICATSLLGSSQMGFGPPSPTDLHDLGTYLVFAPPNAGLHSSV